jgi:hypothetical protein
MENNPGGEGAFHGRTGPLPVRQRTDEELTPSQAGFIGAAVARGFKRVRDFNGAEQDAVGGHSVNVVDGIRQNTAIVFLTAEVRRRPNLTIRGDVTIDRVLFDGTTATGVVAADGTVYRAGEVILSAGSYGSPAILLRSGVGPAAELTALGISVVADLPVGRRLQDHPYFHTAQALAPGHLEMTPAVGALLWTASSEAAAGEMDLHITATHLIPPSYSRTGGVIALSHTLGAMKGVMMKIGQMASYVDDGLSPAVRRTLARLQDSVPPMAPELAATVVAEELGAPPERAFARWDPQPIAAASIGQVHRAVTLDGQAVAVKVQYPNIAEMIAADLRNVALLRGILRITAPAQDVDALLAELRDRVLEELDYRRDDVLGGELAVTHLLDIGHELAVGRPAS